MKMKRASLSITITALIVTVILIWERAYYVASAVIVGALLIWHRELWSLIRRRKLPPVDERVRENLGKSLRNGFVFLLIALAFLMLPFSAKITDGSGTVPLLGGLFLSGGAAYLLSYIFYDRVEPRLGERGLRMLRIFLLTAGISLAVFIISVALHNIIYGLFEIWFGKDFWLRTGIKDEPVFFIIALLSVVSFAVGLIGSLVIFIKGLLTKAI